MRKCENCYYGGMCACEETCLDYTPITEEDESDLLFEEMEGGREQYRAEWIKYTSQYE